MDGQYTSSGFQLYGQPLQAPTVQQPTQGITPPAPTQQLGGFTIIPAAPGTAQPPIASMRTSPVQILQQPPTGQQKAQGTLGATYQQSVPGQPTQPQPQPTQQPRIQPQLQGLTSQQLQYLQATQNSGQLTAFQSQPPQPPQQLGTIQILQPKPQPIAAQRPFQQQPQPAVQGIQVMPQPPPQAMQPAPGAQAMQGVQPFQGLQSVPGVQVLQQYPNYASQVTTGNPPKQAMGSGFQPPGHHPAIPAPPGTGSGHHTGSLFSNSNQRGGYGQGRYAWTDRDRPDRNDFRGRPRDRIRRDDRGSMGARPPVRDPPRVMRDREPFRHDRSNRDRYDRRDYHRDKDFRERKPSPMHHAHDFKKDDGRNQRRDPPKPVQLPIVKDLKPAFQPMPVMPKPPPQADYIVKVPQVPFVTHERDYSDIARRYTHLHVAPDFTKLICHWAKDPGEKRYPYGCSLCPLNKPVKFETVQGPLEQDVEIVFPAAKNEADAPVRWNAKCTFVCGLDDASHAEVLKGKFDGGTHFINAFKFVVVREERDKKKSGIMCLGGPYDADIDGGNPEQSDEGLKAACIRHVKEQTLLDLSRCTTWIRFCDIHYIREDSQGVERPEITAMFLVDISEIVPTAEEWPAVWKEQMEWKQRTSQLEMAQATMKTEADAGSSPKEAVDGSAVKQETQIDAADAKMESDVKMEDMPTESSFLLKCRSAKNGKLKTMTISLDGLLDYDESDKDEATFELSLMAESFNEMLMRDYGSLILKALTERTNTEVEKDKKRPAIEPISEVTEPQVKKPKPATEESTQPETAVEAMEVHSQDSPGDVVHVGDLDETHEISMKESEIPSTTVDAPADTPAQAEDVEMKDHQTGDVDQDLLFAFRFFDRAGCGYIKCDDLRRLLHNLGCCLAPRVVRELVHGAAAANKEKHDRVFYRNLTDKQPPADR